MILLSINDRPYILDDDNEDRLFAKLRIKYDPDTPVKVFVDGELDPGTKQLDDIFNF